MKEATLTVGSRSVLLSFLLLMYQFMASGFFLVSIIRMLYSCVIEVKTIFLLLLFFNANPVIQSSYLLKNKRNINKYFQK